MSSPDRKSFNRGRWELQRERGRISDAIPPNPLKDAFPLNRVVSGLLRKLDAQTVDVVELLAREWKMVAGEPVAAHSRPGRMENRKLTVLAENSMWLYELTRVHKAALLARIQKRLGRDVVDAVFFQLDADKQKRDWKNRVQDRS